jgi:hypothetical protein
LNDSGERLGRLGWLGIFLTSCAIAGVILAWWSLGVTSRRHLIVLLSATYLAMWLLAFILSRASAREMCGRFLAVLLALGVTWSLLEVTALTGLVDVRARFRAGGAEPWLEPGNLFDPELLWKREPNLHVSGFAARGNTAQLWNLPPSGPGHRYELAYDRNGFRNEADFERSEIVVIGDSYIEAVETPAEKTAPVLLSRMRGESVANLGLSGYGPQQELAVLRRYAVPLHPKIVLWAFYEGNDLRDALDYETLQQRLKEGFRTRPSRVERTWAVNLLNVLERMLRKSAPSAVALERYGTFRTREAAEVRVYFVDPCDTLGERDGEGLAILEESLRKAYETARAEGFRLVVLYVPSKFRVLRGFVEFPRQSECRDWTGNDLPERLRRIVALFSSEGDFVDLTPALTTIAASGELPHLPDDTHWTPLGHEAVARAVAEALGTEAPKENR